MHLGASASFTVTLILSCCRSRVLRRSRPLRDRHNVPGHSPNRKGRPPVPSAGSLWCGAGPPRGGAPPGLSSGGASGSRVARASEICSLGATPHCGERPERLVRLDPYQRNAYCYPWLVKVGTVRRVIRWPWRRGRWGCGQQGPAKLREHWERSGREIQVVIGQRLGR